MALFDALIDELASRFKLGPKAAPLAREALALIVGADGGIAGFLDRFERAGLGATAASWLGQAAPAPLTAADLGKALGAPALDSIAHRVGVALPAASAALAYALPKLVGLLTPDGSVPAVLPAEVAGFFGAPASPAARGGDAGHGAEVKPIVARSVAPAWLWPVVTIGAVVGLGWAVSPILFPSPPREANATRAAAPAPVVAEAPKPAPAVAEAPKPAPAPAVAEAPKPAAAPAPAVVEAPKVAPAPAPAVAEAPKSAPAAVAEAPKPAPAAAVAEAPKPAPALTSTFAITDDDDVAAISGAVHDDRTRAAILDALKGAFGADKVKGDVSVDANRSEAPWLPNLRAALDAMKIPGVSATFEGASVKFGGAIVDADRETISASLKSVLGDGLTIGAIADAFAGAEASANAKATTALGSLETGFSGDELVSVLNQSVVNFPYGSAKLPASVQTLLGAVAASVKKLPPGARIEVAGYTDNTGDPDAEVAMSQRRAEAVRDSLVKAGAPADLIVPRGYGRANPIARNDTSEGRLRNKRIEYHVLEAGQTAKAAAPVAAAAPTTATPAPVPAPATATAAPAPAPAPAAKTMAAPAPAAPAPATPAILSIDEQNGVVSVSGSVHDDTTRKTILEALAFVFGADAVKGDVAVDPARADAPWLDSLRVALGAANLPGLQATFEGSAVKLGGAISEADRQKLAGLLKAILGHSVTVGSLAP